jgi:Cytochrome P460
VRHWVLAGGAIVALTFVLSAHRIAAQVPATSLDQTGGTPAVPNIDLPNGYRDWTLISVAAVGPPINDVRAKLGNDIAMADLRQGTIPYRDGAVIARLAWKQMLDPQTTNALRMQAQAVGLSPEAIAKALSRTFVAGEPTNVQFMIKDSKEYASTGGWGFAQFTNGKPDAIVEQTCYACHSPAKATDFVFTHYSP